MDVTLGNVQAMFQGLKATFADALKTTEIEDIVRLMEQTPSNTGTENYPVATLLGDLEEVIDEVTITSIGRWVQAVPNKTFARIVQVKREHVADDNIGVYRPGVRLLARRAALYPLRLAVECLLRGFVDVWVDGQAVFSGAHIWVGGGPWSNLGAPAALAVASFDAACLALETRAGPGGAALGLTPRLLVVGPQNRAAAEALVEVEFLAGGASNRLYKRCDLMVLPRFGTSRAWFVIDDEYGKSMVLQNREGPEFVEKEDPRDDDAFYREVFAYKGRRRCAVAILAPWLIQANVGA